MEDVDRLRARRRPGARDLQRLPGPVRGRAAARARCCPTTHLRFRCRQVEVEVVNADTVFTRACDAGRAAVDPGASTRRGATGRPTSSSTRSRPTGRSSCATRRARTPTAPRATSPASATRPATSWASCPIPSTPSTSCAAARADGLKLFASAAAVAPCLRRPSLPTVDERRRPRPHARRVRAHRRQARPRAQPGRARDVLAAVERALRLQALQAAAARRCPPRAAHVVMGPGENAGAGRRRRRPGRRLQGRVAQPPERGRALPGRGHRRRRHPARHLRARRAADRGARLAALRRARASERSRYLLDHAVAGIGHYGNSIGVPTIGGEVYFEAPYEQNCLVNAMALGLAETRRMIRSAAAGVGNVVVLFGASTGRDGIGGASVLASAELDEADGDKRPTVQVGDPFAEKKLMECSLELLERGLLVSLQDLGAAGPDLVGRRRWRPRAASGSTSTSRACRCARPTWSPSRSWSPSPRSGCCASASPRASTTCSPSARAGRSTARRSARSPTPGAMRIFRGDELVGDMPVAALVDDCPVYELAPAAPGGAALRRRRRRRSPRGGSVREALLALLASPNLASRRPLFEQYDCDRAVAHRAPPGGGRRRGARAPRRRRPRRVDRRQRPPRGRRPLPGARSRRCSSARPTSPASAPSRSA